MNGLNEAVPAVDQAYDFSNSWLSTRSNRPMGLEPTAFLALGKWLAKWTNHHNYV